jgi:predicted dithiol-disulfide oxidoreductase (DUF899 family)
MVDHAIVSQEEWIEARKRFLAKEKEFSRVRDELSRERRELPWVLVDKSYLFQGSSGKETLCDLFAGRDQLIVQHFMFGPDWKEGCPICSFKADHTDAAVVHLAQRGVTFVAVSRAPMDKIEAFKKRMGWRFNWVSSFENDFNSDYHVSFTKEELAAGKVNYNFDMRKFHGEEAYGLSVFFKDTNGEIYHTYSTYGRGMESFMGTYNLLDCVPKGRDEEGLPWPMVWVRHHDKYTNGFVAGVSHA